MTGKFNHGDAEIAESGILLDEIFFSLHTPRLRGAMSESAAAVSATELQSLIQINDRRRFI